MKHRIEEHSHPFQLSTRYLVGELPEPGPAPLLVALHGQGMSADRFLRILLPLDKGPLRLVIPEGMYPYEIRREDRIVIGYSWYLYRGDQAEFRAHLARSEEHLRSLLDEIEARHPVDRKRSVLLGFSQGGYLAGFVGLRHRDRFGGLVIASARLKHEFLEKELQAGDLPRTLMTPCRNAHMTRTLAQLLNDKH